MTHTESASLVQHAANLSYLDKFLLFRDSVRVYPILGLYSELLILKSDSEENSPLRPL